MFFDAKYLLAADQLRQDLLLELDFAKIIGRNINFSVVESGLDSAKADLAEAYALIPVLNSGELDQASVAAIDTKISELVGHASLTLESLRQTIGTNPQPSDLFAVTWAQTAQLIKHLALAGSGIEQLNENFPELARPIRERLTEAGALLRAAQSEVAVGEAALRVNDSFAAVSRKQAAEQLLAQAKAILHSSALAPTAKSALGLQPNSLLATGLIAGTSQPPVAIPLVHPQLTQPKVTVSATPSVAHQYPQEPNPAPVFGKKGIKRAIADWLEGWGGSRKDLLKHLVDECGYSKNVVSKEIDKVGINWNREAARQAKWYLNNKEWEFADLVSQLKYDGFTTKQAEHGAKSVQEKLKW